MQSIHVPVLLKEVIEGLIGEGLIGTETISVSSAVGQRGNRNSFRAVPTLLDGTLGGAGHAKAIADSLNGKLTIVGLDRDEKAIERARVFLEGKAEKLILECESFRNLDIILAENDIREVDMILLDLGISSDELENSGRGFTFQKDEPLQMTMGDPATYAFTAKDIVNRWSEEDISNVIFGYGEDRFARRIAKAIVAYREKKGIETSTELAEIVKGAVPGFARYGKIHPATKTFQALRITVNDELGALKKGLEKGYTALAKKGRMAVISFHSLEDRIVKEFYKKCLSSGARIITKRPIRAGDDEKLQNPRARSARLRIIEKHI